MITLDPKSRFRASPHAKRHQELVLDPGFLAALEASLAQMQLLSPAPENPSKGWDGASQLAGAKRFIEVLLNLAEPDPNKPTPPRQNLDHKK